MAFTPFPASPPSTPITDLTEKLVPIGADEILISDSEDSNSSKKVQLANLPYPPSGGGGAYFPINNFYHTFFSRVAGVNLQEINSHGANVIVGTDSGVGYFYRSTNDGVTFSQVTGATVPNMPATHSNSGIFKTPTGRIIYHGHDGTLVKAFIRYTDDGGATWFEPTTIPNVTGNTVVTRMDSDGSRIVATCYNINNYANGAGTMYSDDNGVTWTFTAALQNNPWSGISYANGLFVAVAWSGTNRVMTSPDGITWTLRTAASALPWSGLAYGNGVFVAASDSGTTQRIMTSPDGITWTLRTHPSMGGLVGRVRYFSAAKVFVYTGAYSTSMMFSHNGIAWTALPSLAENGSCTHLHKGRWIISHTFNASGARITYSDIDVSQL